MKNYESAPGENKNIMISEGEISFNVKGIKVSGVRMPGEQIIFNLEQGLITDKGSTEEELVIENVEDIEGVKIIDNDSDYYHCFKAAQHIKIGDVELIVDQYKNPQISGPSVEAIEDTLKKLTFNYFDPGDI